MPIAVIAANVAVLVRPSLAAAAIRTEAVTFNLNSSAPTFNPPPQLPLLTVAVSYDDSGTVTVTKHGGDPAVFEPTPFTISLSGPGGSEVDIDDFWNLTEGGVGGALQPTNSSTTGPGPPASADGSWTAIWSNPMLARRKLTFVTIDGNQSLDPLGGVYNFFGSFYFPGYAPSVSITNPGPQEAGYQIGPIAPVAIDGHIVGAAAAETDPAVLSPPRITGYTATGLPPGLSINRMGQISGTPTRVGTFDATVSARGQYNYGTQHASASTNFRWVIDPPPPAGMPTNYNGDRIRPGVVVISPTGAIFLAGYRSTGLRGRSSLHGRLRWTRWNATDGWATGGLWTDNCRPNCASGTYHAVRVRVHVYRQNFFWSMFTRMTIQPARGRSFTMRAHLRNGTWYWQ